MYRRFKNLKNKEKGQGLVEYALILVLVAIVVIAALMVLGPTINSVFGRINASLSSVAGSAAPFSQMCSGYSSGTVMHYHQTSGGFWSYGSIQIPEDTGSYTCP